MQHTNIIKENHPGEEESAGNTPHFFLIQREQINEVEPEQFNFNKYFDVSLRCIIYTNLTIHICKWI